MALVNDPNQIDRILHEQRLMIERERHRLKMVMGYSWPQLGDEEAARANKSRKREQLARRRALLLTC